LEDKELAAVFGFYIVAFASTTKNFLRGTSALHDSSELEVLLGSKDYALVTGAEGVNRPITVMDLMTGSLMKAIREEKLDKDTYLLMLEPLLQALNSELGASVRIKTTPIPLMYRFVLDLVTLAYLITLPFSLLSQSMSPLVTLNLCDSESVFPDQRGAALVSRQ